MTALCVDADISASSPSCLLAWRGGVPESYTAGSLPRRLRYGEVSGDDAKGKGNGLGECTLGFFPLGGLVSAADMVSGTNVIEVLGGMKGEQNRSWDSKGGDMICGGLEGRIDGSTQERTFGVDGREILFLDFDDF